MPLTVLVIIAFSFHVTWLFQRSQFFYLHSFFLVPLYAVIYFVDHNGHFMFGSLSADSVHFVFKLLPLYLNTVYLVARFKPRLVARPSFSDIAVNVFLLYNVLTAIAYSIYHLSWLPLFYVSYSVPLFAVFFNSRNFAEEVARAERAEPWEKRLLQLYFLGFVLVYAASIFYAIRASITTSLLDSRGVGSIFASSSALIYCLMFAPLLSSIIGRRWPHIVTIGIGVTSLSKTAFLMLPSYALMLYKRFRADIMRNLVLYSLAALLIIAIITLLTPEALIEEWKVKFALEPGETLLSKSYMTRLDLYADAFRIIGDSPFGIGVGNFERFSHDDYRDAHHFVLTMLCESGILVGGAFILSVLIAVAKTAIEIRRGTFNFQHFSLMAIFLIYFFAGGVLQTTGTSELSTIYYTPFYGVALMQLLNLAASVRLRLRATASNRTNVDRLESAHTSIARPALPD